MMSRSGAGLAVSILVYGLIGGCSLPSTGERDLTALVSEHQMRSSIVEGDGFRHFVLVHGDPLTAERVHIYLEGDGLPWATSRRISTDPGPRDPFALRLMAEDPQPAVYLGRPCYHGLARSVGCSPWMWTFGRYGTQVVDSMTSALQAVLPPNGRRRLTLIGYSGGGVIGFLMAERLSEVDRLVTVAANLDIHAWSDAHGYSQLNGSLDPARRSPLSERIRQTHLLGEVDDRVPSQTIARFRALNPQAEFVTFRGYGHRCCWLEDWGEILTGLR